MPYFTENSSPLSGSHAGKTQTVPAGELELCSCHIKRQEAATVLRRAKIPVAALMPGADIGKGYGISVNVEYNLTTDWSCPT